MPSYFAYDLTISSDLAMSDLLAPGKAGNADVEIRVSPPAPCSSDDPSAICYRSASASKAHLAWADVGDLIIEDGNCITVVPDPGADHDTLGLFVVGAGLGVLLHQRGLLVFHASGVRIGDCIVGFLGAKGWGKSTTAMALRQRGHEVVSDEHLVIRLNDEDQPMVLPGSSPIKLWADALTSTGGETQSSVPVRQGLEKYYASPPICPHPPTVLQQLFLLDAGERLSVEQVSPSQAFFGVVPHLYVSRFGTGFLQAIGPAPAFAQLTRLVTRVPVSRLIRRRDLGELEGIARLVESCTCC